MKIKFLTLLFPLAAFWAGCTPNNPPDDGDDNGKPAGASDFKMALVSREPIYPSGTYSPFKDGDSIGTYILLWPSPTAKICGPITGSRYLDNGLFEVRGTTPTPAEEFYYPESKYDVYSYYPYQKPAIAAGSSTLNVSVRANQSTAAAYHSSDFMLGKSSALFPSASAVAVNHSHMMSRVNVNVFASSGYTLDQLAAAQIEVSLNNINTKGKFDFVSSTFSGQSDPKTITFNGTFAKNNANTMLTGVSAIIVPQTVAKGAKLLDITIDGAAFPYLLPDHMTFDPKMDYSLNVYVSRPGGNVSVSVEPIERYWLRGNEFVPGGNGGLDVDPMLMSTQHVNAIVDNAHDFAFYNDGRIQQRYLRDHAGHTLWRALYDYNYANVNLVILPGCDNQISYTTKDTTKLRTLLKNGVGVVAFGEANRTATNNLIGYYGATFKNGATQPFKAMKFTNKAVATKGGTSYLEFEQPEKWTVVVEDAQHRPVAAYRKLEKGIFAVCPRSLMGDHPGDNSDSINASILSPLFVRSSLGYMRKASDQMVDSKAYGVDLGNVYNENGLYMTYTDYMAPYADLMGDLVARMNPVHEEIMGVPLSSGMGNRIVLLPTGGGGFSSGGTIALAVWWGNFPQEEVGMIEFIGHETTHSWVLPHPEVWNEPIATYVGNLLQFDMGYTTEPNQVITDVIKRYTDIDPTKKKYDIYGKSNQSGVSDVPEGQVNDCHWGKTYIMLEMLRAVEPEIIAKYFQKKRAMLPTGYPGMTMDDTVALLSNAMGKDLFPLFREYGFNVSKAGATIGVPSELFVY